MQYMHIAFFPVFRLKNKKPKNQKKTIKPKKTKKTTFHFEKIMVFSTPDIITSHYHVITTVTVGH